MNFNGPLNLDCRMALGFYCLSCIGLNPFALRQIFLFLPPPSPSPATAPPIPPLSSASRGGPLARSSPQRCSTKFPRPLGSRSSLSPLQVQLPADVRSIVQNPLPCFRASLALSAVRDMQMLAPYSCWLDDREQDREKAKGRRRLDFIYSIFQSFANWGVLRKILISKLVYRCKGFWSGVIQQDDRVQLCRMNQADLFDEFLELIGGEFDPPLTTKVVGFVDIFPMALVSFNFDQRFRRYHQNCVAVPLEKLCAETVYLFSTYLEADFPLSAVTKVVEIFCRCSRCIYLLHLVKKVKSYGPNSE